jgi:F420-dependent methylenetetrahydromethanopterin dehydrogenase
VKMVTPTNAGCIVHFDKGHTIGITTSAREVATVADTLRREARAVVTAE